jgi:hypothetical protein
VNNDRTKIAQFTKPHSVWTALLDAVAAMREAQRAYFNPKTRSKEILIKSKQLEAEVDRQVIALRSAAAEARVPGDPTNCG